MGWPITKPSTIYAIRCTVNGKIYIGRTHRLEGRVREHFRDRTRRIKNMTEMGRYTELGPFDLDFDRYGRDRFEVYIIEENVPPEICQEREAFWISEYNATNPDFGYNKRPEIVPGVDDFIRGVPPKKKEEEGVSDNA